MFKINKKTIMLINTLTNYNILASNGKLTFQNFYICEDDKRKIYKLKNWSVFKENINEHFKNSDTLNFKQIQEYINKLPKCENIEIYDYKKGENIKNIYMIGIIKDPDEVFLQRKKCTLNFVCKSCELEDKFKNPIKIDFNETVNEETSIVDYIKNTYHVESFSDDDFSLIDKEINLKIDKYGKYYLSDGEYTIELNKPVEGITKKKEDDYLIFNISLKVNDPTKFKLKNNNTVLKLKLKKNTKKKEIYNHIISSYNIDKTDILRIIDDKNEFIAPDETLLKEGSYTLIFKDKENDFVEKNIKKTTNKNITLVPQNENKYELKGINNNITINVPENISYTDFVNEVKKTITDGKFEVYIDNNKIENGNIDINKEIVIILLDDCNKLKEIKKDDKGDGDGDGDGNKGGGNNNNTDNNNTQTKQKKYCGSKCGKK